MTLCYVRLAGIFDHAPIMVKASSNSFPVGAGRIVDRSNDAEHDLPVSKIVIDVVCGAPGRPLTSRLADGLLKEHSSFAAERAIGSRHIGGVAAGGQSAPNTCDSEYCQPAH